LVAAIAGVLVLMLVVVVVLGGSHRKKPMPPPPPVQPTGNLPSINVAAGGDLAAATAQLADTGTLHLAAGDYPLPHAFVINRPITLVGDGAASTHIIVTSDEPAIMLALPAGQLATLVNLSIERRSDRPGDVVRVDSGQVWIGAARIAGAAGSGTGCVRGAAGSGIVFGGRASGTITGSALEQNCQGVAIQSAGSVVLDQDTLRRNIVAGVFATLGTTSIQGGNMSRNAVNVMACRTGDPAVSSTGNIPDNVIVWQKDCGAKPRP
jgi:hypothetical protein